MDSQDRKVRPKERGPIQEMAGSFLKLAPLSLANGLVSTPEYYYDEPLPAGQLEKNNPGDFPPGGLNLSDAWIVKIVKSDLEKEDRFKAWPAVFSSKYLTSGFRNKG